VVDARKGSRVLLAEVRDLASKELTARVLSGGRPASLQEVQDDSSGEVVVNRHGVLQHDELAQDGRHELRDVFTREVAGDDGPDLGLDGVEVSDRVLLVQVDQHKPKAHKRLFLLRNEADQGAKEGLVKRP
jgi:hypothetical protein